MYIRAHQNNTIGKIQFFRYDFDYAARDCETNKIISLVWSEHTGPDMAYECLLGKDS